MQKPNGFREHYNFTIYQQENIVVLELQIMDYYNFVSTFIFFD